MGLTMNHETAVSSAKEIADRVLAPAARQNDKEGRFSSEAIKALGPAGLLGIMLPADCRRCRSRPPHVRGDRQRACRSGRIGRHGLSHARLRRREIAAARKGATVAPTLKEIAAGRHLSTLAFSEAGSRSHFWAPVSRARRNAAGVHITAKKSFVTSAGQASSYVVSALAPQGTAPTDSTLYLIASGARGLSVAGAWDGLGLRANASAPMTLDDCEVSYESQLTDDGAGFQAMLQVVLPLFNLGSAAVALGICRAAVAGTATHLKSARFEHLGQSLGESLPTLRAQIATMQIDTDGLAARIDDLIDHLERPRDTTVLRVLESKAAAGDTAIAVTSAALRICGGAAFAKHMAVERLFRDAHAGAVMAPTGDVLREFIGKAVLGMPLF
jgi:alkylation response protein AidB-like acyl-CoA dehydrogenase